METRDYKEMLNRINAIKFRAPDVLGMDDTEFCHEFNILTREFEEILRNLILSNRDDVATEKRILTWLMEDAPMRVVVMLDVSVRAMRIIDNIIHLADRLLRESTLKEVR